MFHYLAIFPKENESIFSRTKHRHPRRKLICLQSGEKMPIPSTVTSNNLKIKAFSFGQWNVNDESTQNLTDIQWIESFESGKIYIGDILEVNTSRKTQLRVWNIRGLVIYLIIRAMKRNYLPGNFTPNKDGVIELPLRDWHDGTSILGWSFLVATLSLIPNFVINTKNLLHHERVDFSHPFMCAAGFLPENESSLKEI